MKGIALLLLIAFAGCEARLRFESQPTTPPNWEEVTCDECNGTGKVTYDESSPEIFERGTFTCSMCQGEGTLYIEHRP